MKIHDRLSLFITIIASFAFTSEGKGQTPNYNNYPKYEVRAVWLTTLAGLDWPHNKAIDTNSVEKQKQELTDILDKLKAANINTILFQARTRAASIYPSSIEPWDACLTGTYGKSPGYDPLAFAIDECHKRGMEIQAWIVTMPVGKWNSENCKAIRKKNPGLIVKIGTEGYIDPSSPMAALYIANICREITSRYDIDGIHLDYIRYPETWPLKMSDRLNKKRKRNYHTIADDINVTTRQKNITAIVRAAHNAIKQLKPWVKLSCATIGKHSDLARYSSRGWNALVKGCQDTQKWLETGIVDQLYPMAYFQGDNFYPFIIDWKENSYGHTIVPGIGIYRLTRNEGDWPIGEIIRQMHVSRAAGMGFAMFRERFLLDNTKGLYEFTKDEFAPFPALVPPIQQSSGQNISTPQNLRTVKHDGYETLIWDKNPEEDNGTAYNIYASSTYPVDTDNPCNLIAIRHPNRHITIKTERKLYFAVTSTNRYGIESPSVQQVKATTSDTGKFIYNDGTNISLPPKDELHDVEYILLKDLSGRNIATRPYKGYNADISELPDGCYTIYSLNAKGITHRLGFTIIKRSNTI